MNKSLPAALFANFLTLSSDAVVVVDEAQRIIFFNMGAERIFGWTATEVDGLSLATLLPERFHAAHTGLVRGFAAAHGLARTMGERQQISGRRKNGEEFPAEASIQQMYLDGGQIYAAMLRDISPRQRAEDTLRLAVKARDDMIGIVSHDLRNPANAVKMLATSLLSEAAELPAPFRQRVAIMLQAAVQMDTLIQDLLDVTRLEAGRLVVSPRPTSIAHLVLEAVTPLRPLADDRQITLDVVLPEDVGDVDADIERVSQALSNLVGNSLKFTESGGHVGIAVIRHGGFAEFQVRDNGVGIPADQVPHVFDRFFQARQEISARRHGAGLGLPIARGIIEAHGGTIQVESQEGYGTVVRFTLPLST